MREVGQGPSLDFQSFRLDALRVFGFDQRREGGEFAQFIVQQQGCHLGRLEFSGLQARGFEIENEVFQDFPPDLLPDT